MFNKQFKNRHKWLMQRNKQPLPGFAPSGKQSEVSGDSFLTGTAHLYFTFTRLPVPFLNPISFLLSYGQFGAHRNPSGAF